MTASYLKKAKSTTAKSSSTSSNELIPIHHLQINNRNQNKNQSISYNNTTTTTTTLPALSIDKSHKTIYFDQNGKWSLKFNQIFNLDQVKIQLENMMQECKDMDTTGGMNNIHDEDVMRGGEEEEVEMELKLFGKKGERYHCIFLVSSLPLEHWNNPRNFRHHSNHESHNSIIPFQSMMKFVHSTYKVLDKWDMKQKKMMGNDNDDDGDYQRLDSFGQIRNRKPMSSLSHSHRASNTIDSSTYSSNVKQSLSSRKNKVYGSRANKIQRRLDQLIMNDDALDHENDEDDNRQPTSTVDDVCSLNNEDDDNDKMEGQDEVTTKKRKHHNDDKNIKNNNVAMGKRRLVKRGRISNDYLDDSDDDFNFDSSTNDKQNDHHDEIMTEITKMRNRPAVVVSPTHAATSNHNGSSNDDGEKRKRKDMDNEGELSDAVTDVEEENESVVDAEENKGLGQSTTIHSFFKPKSSSDNVVRGNKMMGSDNNRRANDIHHIKNHTIRSSEKDEMTTSKYFAKNQSISTADQALEAAAKMSSPTPKIQTSPKPITAKQSPPPLKKSIVNPYTKSNVKPQSTYVGLKNLGNTCYLNSSLQMIFSVPEFLIKLQNLYDQLSNEEGMPLTRSLLKVAWDSKIISSSQGLMNEFTMRSVDPREVKEAIDVLTNKFMGYEQRDAHEFASALIDYIHDELVKITKEKEVQDVTLPTDEYFKLDVKVCLTCDSCNYTR